MLNQIKELCSVMMEFKQALNQISPQSAEDRTATILQYSTLDYLSKNNKSGMSAIASHLHISLSSATQLIERLVRAGYINRIDDKIDRRIVQLEITNAGEQELVVLRKSFHSKMEKAFSSISKEDLNEFIRIQRLVIANMQEKKI